MNDLYAKRHGIPVDNTNCSTPVKLANELIRKQQESKERSERILDYYRGAQQKKCENIGGLNNGI